MSETKAELEKRVDLADTRLGAIAAYTHVIRVLTLPYDDVYDGVDAEAVKLLADLGEAASEIARSLRNRDRLAAEATAGLPAVPDARVMLSADSAGTVAEVAVKLYLSANRDYQRAQTEQGQQLPRAVA